MKIWIAGSPGKGSIAAAQGGTSVGSSGRAAVLLVWFPRSPCPDSGNCEPAIPQCFYSAWSEEPDTGLSPPGGPEEGATGL